MLKEKKIFFFYMIKTTECRGGKKKREREMFVLSSSLRTPDPSLLLRNPGLLINLPLIPPFSFRRVMLPRERGIVFVS